MRRLFLLVLTIVLALSAAAQTKSTPEERRWAVETTHWLEEHPTDAEGKSRSAALMRWWVAVPDLTLSSCPMLLEMKNESVGEAVVTQAMFSWGAWMIEHPEASRADLVMAGVEGGLRAYANAVSKDEKLRDSFLDQLVAAQAAGKLKETYVDAAVKHCDEADSKKAK
ncbi:MAG TPA: hypothetical protein VNN08_17420 [Thermoanaerobaculia bacterium]|nr:hypothetical protein [Thermoanaerobaculia bacterium]